MPKHPLVNAPEPINASVPYVQTMHGDTSNSDCSVLQGPELGADSANVTFFEQKATFPTLLRRTDGHVMGLATSFAVEDNLEEGGKIIQAQVVLINGDTGATMGTSQSITQVSMMAGVYAYLDQRALRDGVGTDRLVVTSASPSDGLAPTTIIQGVTASVKSNGSLTLDPPEELADITDHLCPSQPMPKNKHNGDTVYQLEDDAVVSLSPDVDGDIWFATAQGRLGITRLNGAGSGSTQSVQLAMGETINNSFSTASHPSLGCVAAITTNATLRLVQKNSETGAPRQVWSQAYDYGDALKPGQLQPPACFYQTQQTDHQFGTGSTPTFFGPDTGCEWVAITDNASGALNLLVYCVETGILISQKALFETGNPQFQANSKGTENSLMAHGTTLIIPSTCGYPYPVPPLFVRRENPFVGGLTRFNLVQGDGDTYALEHAWTHYHRSAAVPKYAFNEDKIYTVLRSSPHQDDVLAESRAATSRDTYSVAEISASDGRCLHTLPIEIETTLAHDIGAANTALDPLQMACCFTVDSSDRPVMWQGTFSGYARISS